MILVFDLDDTLYDEIDYVHSGMRAVARYARGRWGIPRAAFLTSLLGHLERQGRGRVFDSALAEQGIRSRAAVAACLAAYRRHAPRIALHRPGRDALARFAATPKYLVTDGNALVQERKIAALGIRERFRRVFVTHRYGTSSAKPNPHCFLRIAALERVTPADVVYVADNPHKDFVGIRPLGFRTIRVRTGPYRSVSPGKRFEADRSIATLDSLTAEMIDALVSSTANMEQQPRPRSQRAVQ
jgi:putative hydrolase of the HAD superfamily